MVNKPSCLSRADFITGLVPKGKPIGKVRREHDSAKGGNRILRPVEVAERLGISRANVYQLIAPNENFPALKKLGARVVGSIESEIDDCIASLPDAS